MTSNTGLRDIGLRMTGRHGTASPCIQCYIRGGLCRICTMTGNTKMMICTWDMFYLHTGALKDLFMIPDNYEDFKSHWLSEGDYKDISTPVPTFYPPNYPSSPRWSTLGGTTGWDKVK